MTRRQLLANADSMELTLWQLFLAADAAHQEERMAQAKAEAELKQWVNAKD